MHMKMNFYLAGACTAFTLEYILNSCNERLLWNKCALSFYTSGYFCSFHGQMHKMRERLQLKSGPDCMLRYHPSHRKIIILFAKQHYILKVVSCTALCVSPPIVMIGKFCNKV